jgi:hypothetical protein
MPDVLAKDIIAFPWARGEEAIRRYWFGVVVGDGP